MGLLVGGNARGRVRLAVALVDQPVELLVAVADAEREAGVAAPVDAQPVLRVRVVLVPVVDRELRVGGRIAAQAGEGGALGRLEGQLDAEDLSVLPGDPLSAALVQRVVAVVVVPDLRQVLRSAVGRLGQRLPRRLGIEGVGLGLDRAGDVGRNPGQGRDAGAVEDDLAVGLAVEGVGERLAHLLVLERLHVQVEIEVPGIGRAVDEELLAQLRVVLDLGDLGRVDAHDVDVVGAVGLQRGRAVGDVDVLDAVDRRLTEPIVLVWREGGKLLLLEPGELERAVADVVGRVLPPGLAAGLDELLLDRVEDPEAGDRREVRSRRDEADLQRPVVDHRHAEVGLGCLVRLGVVDRDRGGGLGVVEVGELGAADHDVGEDVLVAAGDVRVAGALDGVAEVLGGQRRAIAVGEPFPQGEGDRRRVLVELPALRRRRDRLEILVEARQPLVDQGPNADLGQGRADLGIEGIGIDTPLDAQDLFAIILCRGADGYQRQQQRQGQQERGTPDQSLGRMETHHGPSSHHLRRPVHSGGPYLTACVTGRQTLGRCDRFRRRDAWSGR